jgi:hypothetical protein
MAAGFGAAPSRAKHFVFGSAFAGMTALFFLPANFKTSPRDEKTRQDFVLACRVKPFPLFYS